MSRVDAESGQHPATNPAKWPDSDHAATVRLESGHDVLDTERRGGAAGTEESDTSADTIAGVPVTGDVLDVPQVASLLAVGRNTIYALVAKNQIPHRRLGKAIRFSRAAVMSWLSSWSSQDAKERH